MPTKIVTLYAFAGEGRLRIAVDGDIDAGRVTRSEGGITMQLVDPVLAIECDGIDFSTLHGDVLALVGVLAFYPALPDEPFELHTNFPVSENIEKALRRKWILEHVRVVGAGRAPVYVPACNVLLSYGGGIDSLAAHLMFPQVPLVHESPLPARGKIYDDVVTGLTDQMDVDNYNVFDNLRQLFSVWGLPVWVSVYIASLIFQPARILSGSEMTGTYLLGGRKYHPRYANVWYRVFSTVGIQILPTSFLSEVGNATVVAHYGRMADAAYCQFISRKDCDKCSKCLRRRVLRAMVDPSDLDLVDSFRHSPEIDEFLSNRPLYYGDVFTHAVAGHERETWVSRRIVDLVELHGRLPFHNAYNPETFDHFSYPKELRTQAEAALACVGIPPFDERAREAFETFDQMGGHLTG